MKIYCYVQFYPLIPKVKCARSFVRRFQNIEWSFLRFEKRPVAIEHCDVNDATLVANPEKKNDGALMNSPPSLKRLIAPSSVAEVSTHPSIKKLVAALVVTFHISGHAVGQAETAGCRRDNTSTIN